MWITEMSVITPSSFSLSSSSSSSFILPLFILLLPPPLPSFSSDIFLGFCAPFCCFLERELEVGTFLSFSLGLPFFSPFFRAIGDNLVPFFFLDDFIGVNTSFFSLFLTSFLAFLIMFADFGTWMAGESKVSNSNSEKDDFDF